jgi:protein-tyrosine phosphatase
MQTELHFHLLPGVDDGPPDDTAALTLARAAVADGTERVVTTPHVRLVRVSQLAERVRRLRELLSAGAVPLEVCCGGELSPDDVGFLSQADLEQLAHGPTSRRWLLLEAPLGPCRPDLSTACAMLRERGYETLIGHPERSPHTTLDELRHQVGQGAFLQLNASSLLGRHGPQASSRGWELAESGLPFVLASDAHSLSRPPLLSEAARRLESAGFAAETVHFAAHSGPARLLSEGLPLAADHVAAGVSSSRSSERRSSRETCICE